MATPARLDFRGRGNATFTAILSLSVNGAPYDLTACTLAAQLRYAGDLSSAAAPIALVNQASAVEGVSIYGTDPTQGQVYMQINQATLQALLTQLGYDHVQFWWDLRVTRPGGGGVDVPIEGSFLLSWGATR